MTSTPRDRDDLDHVLRAVLADDLPADVEAGMTARVCQFRARTAEDGTRTWARSWPAWREAWAIVSVLMLVAGALLQGTGSRTALAERIAHLKAVVAAQETGR
jgi:hypothetical protein